MNKKATNAPQEWDLLTPRQENFLTFADQLPGHFFIDNLQGQVVHHNRAANDFFFELAQRSSVVGLDNLDIAVLLDPTQSTRAKKYAKRIKSNIDWVIKDKKPFIFEEEALYNDRVVSIICYRTPLYEQNGNLIGHYGYGYIYDINTKIQTNHHDHAHRILNTLLEANHDALKNAKKPTIATLAEILIDIQETEKHLIDVASETNQETSCSQKQRE